MKAEIEYTINHETDIGTTLISCHIPELDLYFSCEPEEMESRGNAMVKSYFNYIKYKNEKKV